jgi:F-type H+-transporting ATPase subunit b
MKHLVLLLLAGLTFLSASEHGGETDIIPRTVNFLIFAGLIYYLIAGHIKNFFGSRQEGIASELDKVEEKIKASKKAKEAAMMKIEEAKKTAQEIKETTAKEIELMVKRIEENSLTDLTQLDKQKDELMRVSDNKMIREVVTESLDEVLDINDVAQNKEELIKSLMKKVA